MFLNLLMISFRGVATVFFIGIAGYLIISGGKPNRQYMDVVAKIIKRVALPCLMFTTMMTKFKIDEIEFWWIYPLLSLAITLIAIAFAFVYMKIDRSITRSGEFMALLTFQNGIFLPLALAPVFVHADKLPYFLNLLFLFNLLSVPIFFSLGLVILNTSDKIVFRIRDFFNPPIVATVLGFLFAATGWGRYIPGYILDPAASVGSLASPLSMIFVGGAIVTNIPKVQAVNWRTPIKVALLKCLVFPILACIAVYLIHPPQYMGLLIILESSMPPALLIAVIAPKDSADHTAIASAILLTSLVSILTIPFFIGFYGLMYG